jgi:DNA-binding LacI/PurR family transcriptional regulator
MNKPSPTIYEVARTAGVSITTVSRVLNEPQKVNQKTRQAVLSAIDEIGFIPRAEARARAIKENRRIGVIAPFITAPSFVQRLRGVATALMNTKYELVIYTVDSSDRFHGYLAKLPLTYTLDGLIVMSLPFEDDEANRLIEHHVESVLIEYPQPVFSTVEIDDVAGGMMAAQYLINKGHRRIAFLGDTDLPEYSIHPVSQRLIGFRQALETAGLSIPPEYVILTPYSQEQARQAAHKLMHMSEAPTAIFSATDLQAFGVLKAAREMGLKIPDDLAVIGFDDLDMADYVGLTTVRQHLDDSGRIAVELLLSRLANPSHPVQHVHLPLSIIERETA